MQGKTFPSVSKINKGDPRTCTILTLAWGSNWGYPVSPNQNNCGSSGAYVTCIYYGLSAEIHTRWNVAWCMKSWMHLFCVCFCVCGWQKPEYPNLSTMADEAITQGRYTRSGISLVYMCSVQTYPTTLLLRRPRSKLRRPEIRGSHPFICWMHLRYYTMAILQCKSYIDYKNQMWCNSGSVNTGPNIVNGCQIGVIQELCGPTTYLVCLLTSDIINLIWRPGKNVTYLVSGQATLVSHSKVNKQVLPPAIRVCLETENKYKEEIKDEKLYWP